jgi:hypothetical protein
MFDENLSVTDLHGHRLEGRVTGRPIDALAILKSEYRAVMRAHDSRPAHQQEFTGSRIEWQRKVRTAIDERLDFETRSVQQHRGVALTFPIRDLGAGTIR